MRVRPKAFSETERITCITGGIYPDRAAKQQTPVMQLILSRFLNPRKIRIFANSMQYSVREIRSRRDLRRFIAFPDRLYKACPQYVPALHGDQMHALTKAAPLQYCTRKLWLCEDGKGRIAGRICAIVNPRYNELYGKKRARFGWFDTIEDLEVARLLLGTAEAWAKEMGMDEIHGPLYYNTLGKQGMLVEGFENTPVFNTLYNYKYYNDFVTELGYGKECDWVESKVAADQGVPEQLARLAAVLMERHELHEAKISVLKKDPAWVRHFFEVYNEAFAAGVQNFIPFTEAEIAEEAASVMRFLSDDLSTVLLDGQDRVAGFGIAFPDISKALQKARGHLFPFGWYHLAKALKDCSTIDLMVNGAAAQWRGTGISAVFHVLMSEKAARAGAKVALTNPQIESNSASFVWDKYASAEPYMRRRCYLKKI